MKRVKKIGQLAVKRALLPLLHKTKKGRKGFNLSKGARARITKNKNGQYGVIVESPQIKLGPFKTRIKKQIL